MSARHRPFRDTVCEVCGKPGRTQLKTRDICRSCHRAEPSTRCVRCGLVKHNVSEDGGLCLHCTEMTARPEGACARCSRVRLICNKEDWLCHPCHAAALRRARDRAQPARVRCSVCRELRPSILQGRAICPTCWREERNGRAICARCGRLKSVAVKSEGLCKQCYTTIRHYSLDVIRQLCAYVAAPDADPTEAMALYLILFHALSVQELRHVRIPTILPLCQDARVPTLSEAYYLLLPKPLPSLGDRSPGRPDVRLDFPASAMAWLRNLLDRFERQRYEIVQNPANDYLFVSSATARHIMPVGNVFSWDVVRRASLRILGSSCSPNTLRKTVGVMFADRAGAGILRWMGWDDQQAFAYTWAQRETVHPRLPGGDGEPLPDAESGSINFPWPIRGAL